MVFKFEGEDHSRAMALQVRSCLIRRVKGVQCVNGFKRHFNM